MIRTKDFLLLLIVIFITVVVIQPDDSVLRGIDKNYLLTGLVIVVAIALTHYSRFVVATAVSILAIGANLPHEIAQVLNIDARILLGSLIVVLLVAVANRIIKLPTGLDKPQGIAAAHGSSARNPDIPELNPKNDTDKGSGYGVDIGQYEVKEDMGQILT